MLINRQFLIFITGGLASAVIDIGVMQLLVSLHIPPMLAATTGFFSGLLFNYAFHALFTFRSPTSLAVLSRFLVTVALNYLITMLLVYVSFSLLRIGVLPGKILSLPIVAVNGYLLSKHWVFK
jgi:putative flippase GtrA